jgi:hypothetical protein
MKMARPRTWRICEHGNDGNNVNQLEIEMSTSTQELG